MQRAIWRVQFCATADKVNPVRPPKAGLHLVMGKVPVDGDRIGLRWDVREGRRRGVGELPDRLIRHNIPLGDQIFDMSKGQTEAMVSPDRIADDLVRGNDSQSNETDGLSHHQFSGSDLAGLERRRAWNFRDGQSVGARTRVETTVIRAVLKFISYTTPPGRRASDTQTPATTRRHGSHACGCRSSRPGPRRSGGGARTPRAC